MRAKTGIVFTGGPSAGKSTVIQVLEARGYPVIHEIGTALIKEGWVLPWQDRHGFQMEVLRRQLAAEAQLISCDKLCFLDRGLLDGMAHYIYDGLEVPPEFSTLDTSHYAAVFWFAPLPDFVENGIRFEDQEFQKKFGPLVTGCYRQRGLPVVEVPLMGVEERVDFVLNEASRLILGEAKDL